MQCDMMQHKRNGLTFKGELRDPPPLPSPVPAKQSDCPTSRGEIYWPAVVVKLL